MKNYVIGIIGAKNSGKDTIASMINYIFAVGTTKASYVDYLIKKMSIDNNYKDRIVHFADGLKDILSIMYNISRDRFDDRDSKDNMYYNIKSGTFLPCNAVENKPDVEIITIDKLQNHNIKYILDNSKCDFVYIKIRTLMQYFGTDICRNMLADDIWIRQTMTKVVNIAETRKVCIMPDVRFSNEANVIRCCNVPLYGELIAVKRDNTSNTSMSEHSSENANISADFNIDNNGTLMMLFYKVLEICQKI